MSTTTDIPSPAPVVGNTVLFVLDDGPNEGEARPAFVISVISPSLVSLVVFMDGPNDYDVLPGDWIGASDVDLTTPQGASRKALLMRNRDVGMMLRYARKAPFVPAGGRIAPGSWHWPAAQAGELSVLRTQLADVQTQLADLLKHQRAAARALVEEASEPASSGAVEATPPLG